METGLSPIIKWPGGKEKDLKYIIPNAPQFERYIEPFVGGGSVFMSIEAMDYFINDFSTELIELYRCIEKTDSEFFRYAEMMDESWDRAGLFFRTNTQLVEAYIRYRNSLIDQLELKEFVHSFCKDNKYSIIDIIGTELSSLPSVLIKEMEKNLFRKMVRMRELEIEKHKLPDGDYINSKSNYKVDRTVKTEGWQSPALNQHKN